MVSVLFVCLGNICRSPMAEAVFRHLVKEEGLDQKIRIDSAGTGHWHIGNPPHKGTQQILHKNNIDFTGIRARQIQVKDFKEFEYIIVMDSDNLRNVTQFNDSENVVVKRLLDYTEHYVQKDVPDPYYTGNFQEVYEMVQTACTNLLQDICIRENI